MVILTDLHDRWQMSHSSYPQITLGNLILILPIVGIVIVLGIAVRGRLLLMESRDTLIQEYMWEKNL